MSAIGAWQPLPRWLHLTSMWEAVPSGDLFLDALSAAYLNAIPPLSPSNGLTSKPFGWSIHEPPPGS